MPTTIFTPQMLRNGTRAVPEIPAGGGGGFTNTYSLDFDGVDDYVDCGVITSLNGLSTASWSCWLKISPTETFVSPFGQDEVGGNNGIRLFLMSSGRVDIYLSALKYRVQSNATIIGVFDNEWHNLTVTFNNTNTPTNDICKLYIDGVNVPNASTASTAVLPTLTEPFTIGRWQQNPYNFGGNIDEFAIWDSELSQAEVTSIGGGTPTDLSLLATPPIHWYRMGDNGAYKSPQWLIPNNENKDKVSNYSLSFDGVDDFVDLGDSFDSVFIGAAWSFSAWIKVSANTSYDCFFSKGDSLQFYMHFQRVKIYLGYPYLTNINPLVSATYFSVDTWYHICFTRSGNDNVLYINGSSDASSTSVGSMSTSTTESIIGAITTTPLYPFQGNIDEVAVFDYALTQQNVTDIYNSGTPTTISGAVAHYKMGEDATFSGGVWTVPDAVGSNNGTSANMTIDDRVGEAPNSENNALSLNMDEVDRVEDVPS